MATPYSDVINVFIVKITDYDLPKFTDTEREELITVLMKTATSKFKSCTIDLNDIDDTLKQFNQTLSYDVIDIITEGMIVEWLKPKIFNSEVLKNSLSTKDFSLYSPANLLKELRETLKSCQINYRGLVNKYSFINADFTKLGG